MASLPDGWRVQRFTSHALVEARLGAIRRALVANYEGGRVMPSNAAGRERELFVRDFLAGVLPQSHRFGSGAVTDRYENRTGQLDVVLDLPFAPSLPMPGRTESERLYLAEAVACVIEVKSNISSQWGEITAKAREVSKIRRQLVSETPAAPVMIVPGSERLPFYAVGFAGYKTLEGACERMRATAEHDRPDAFLQLCDPCAWVDRTGAVVSGEASMFVLFNRLFAQLRLLQLSYPDLADYAFREPPTE